MAKFDLEGARKSGYDDKTILEGLAAEQPNFDLKAARAAGYDDTTILNGLAAQDFGKTKLDTLKDAAVQAGKNIVSALTPQQDTKPPAAAGLTSFSVAPAAKPAAAPYDFAALNGAQPQPPAIEQPTRASVVESAKTPEDKAREAAAAVPVPELTPEYGFDQAGTDLRQDQDKAAAAAYRQRRVAELRKSVPQADDRTLANMVEQEIISGKQANPGTVSASNFDFETHNQYQDSGTLERGTARGVNAIKQQAAGLHEFLGDTLGIDSYSNAMADTGKKLDTEAAAIGDRDHYLTRNWEGAVSSIVTQTPGLAIAALSGGSLPLLLMGAQTFGDEYQTGKAAGLSYEDRTMRAGINGVAEIIGERIGMPSFAKVFKDITQGTPTDQLVKDLAKHVMREIPGEQLTTAIQFANDKFTPYGLNQEAGLEQYLGQAADTLVQTVMQAGAMGSVGVAKNAIQARREQSATVGADVARENALAQWDRAFNPPKGGLTRAAAVAAQTGAIDRAAADQQRAIDAAELIDAEGAPDVGQGRPAEPVATGDQNGADVTRGSDGIEPVGQQPLGGTAAGAPDPAGGTPMAAGITLQPDAALNEETDAAKTEQVAEEAGQTQSPQGAAQGVVARVGTTPKNTEDVTVRDGIVYLGNYPAQDFETGEDITVAEPTFEAVSQALKDGGALSSRQRIYGGGNKGKEASANSITGLTEAFSSLKEGGTTDNLYKQALAALQAGKTTIAGVKDPILSRAKAAFDAGKIKNAGDLRRFEEHGYPKQFALPPSVVIPDEPAEIPPIARKAKAPKAVAPAATADEFGERARKQFIKTLKDMGGVTVTEARDISGEPAHIANRMAPGLFRTGGNALDLVARRLHEAGYISDQDYNDVDGGVQAARDLINQALGKEPVMSAADQERYNELLQQEQRLAEQEAALEAEMPARNETLAEILAEEVDDLPGLDSGETDEAAQLRALGYTEEEINAELKTGQGAQTAEGTAAAGTEAGTGAGSGQAEAGQDRGGNGGFALESQTEAGLSAAEQAAKDKATARAKADAAAEAKQQADAERDGFQLTGSVRAADANPGQADIFSQPTDDTPVVKKPGIDPDVDENAPQWAGQYDVVEKGGKPAGFLLLGKNPDGDDVLEAGGMRAVVSGDYVVRELAHKPKDGRVAEFKTVDELAPAPKPVQEKPASTEREPAAKVNKLDAAAASIDTELDAALKELADALKKQSGSLNSGVDPAILALGVKVGSLYVAKGVVKFAQYSKAIIDALAAHGVSPDQIKPYLKQFYVATKQAVDDATFDKMDDDRTVRGFDLDAQEAKPAQASADVRQAAKDAGIAAASDLFDWKSKQSTRAKVKVAILDSLTQSLPQSEMDGASALADEIFDEVLAMDDAPSTEKRPKQGDPGYTLEMAEADLDAMHTNTGEFGTPRIEDDRLNDRIKRQEKLIAEMKAEQQPATRELAPGTRINGEDERKAANRLETLAAILADKGFPMNSPEWAAMRSVKSIVEELRKERTVVSVPEILQAASGTFMRQYPAFADVIDEVIESLGGTKADTTKAEANPASAPVEKIIGDKLETDLPEVEHITTKGKTLQGVITKTLTLEQARTVDKFAWKKDGGIFVRMKHVVRPEAKPAEAVAPAEEQEIKQPTTLDELIGNVDAGYKAHFDYAGADGRTVWIEKTAQGWVMKSKDDGRASVITKGGAGPSTWDKLDALKAAEQDAKYRFTEWKPLADEAPSPVVMQEDKPVPKNHGKGPHYGAGYSAFENGEPRVLPTYFTDRTGKNAKDWYRGWDAANVAAPVDTAAEAATNKAQEGTQDDAGRVPEEGVPAGRAERDPQQRPDGDRTGEPLDAGLAGGGAGTAGKRGVSGGVRAGTESGEGRPGVGDGQQPPRADGDRGNGRAGDGAADNQLDHVISDEDGIGDGGLGAKYRDNIAAIRIIKATEAENRVATLDERKQLARYVGWGALKGVFDPNNKTWAKQHQELRELLTDAEWESARASILNAHYTSPTVIKAMYGAIDRIGFKGGRILEPSMGSGNFFGLMPAAMRSQSKLHGVELDSLTSRLAKALYPNAVIATATGFQEYQVPSGYFDMAYGNPPFGSEAIVDRERNEYSGFSIHNYFIARMIDKTRDGGIVPVIVSHSFMDALNPKAREWVAKRANLLGAVRLPETAFKNNAGTEVVTDILFFQKTATPEKKPAWVNSTDVALVNPKTGEGAKVAVNDYFSANPRNVLGRESLGGTMYSPNSYTVEPTGDLAAQLQAFVESLPANVYQPIERAAEELAEADNSVPDGVKPGSYYIDEQGAVRQRGNDVAGMKVSRAWEPANAGAEKRMRGMIQLRDLLRAQMRMELNDATPEAAIESGRAALNKVYDAFVKAHGYLNSQTNRRIFLDDTEAALVQALEFDYDAGISKARAEASGLEEKKPSAVKADILKRRVLFPPSTEIKVSNARDALLASLNDRGRVDMGFMATAYGKTESEIVAELGDMLFEDPQAGYATSDEYLAGDVKTKLDEAKSAAAGDSRFDRNVKALEKVIPADKLPSEIYASIGANWIPGDVYEAFAADITGGRVKTGYLAATAQWFASIDGGDRGKMTSDYGTDKIDAFEIFKLMLNGRAVEVKKKITVDGKERYVTDEEATEAGRQRMDKIKQHWESWVWNDGPRAERLTGIYNDKHNRTVKRGFDGSHLTLPGMTPTLTLRAHQKNVIWRAIQERNVLLDHVVGAGKTFAKIGIAMEMKRLGIARKPLIVVPNHLTLQWRSDFSRMYPAANVLAATPEDFSKDNRERLFAKIATGDYDAVVIGHSSLKKIGLDPEIESNFLNEQLDEIADAIEDMKKERGDKNIIRDMEKIKATLEAKIEKLVQMAGSRDKVVTFNELGVDALFVDEMHEFKNLFFYTQKQRVSGLGNPKGSGKAFDLFMKIRWMQDTLGDNAPLITATGTPVSNSLSEMFTMQRYMRFNELRRDGLHLFDSWSRMYGEDEYVYEVAPSGVGYRISQRFSKFKNLPSLMGHYQSFADVVTLQDLKDQAASEGKRFPVPKMETGRQQNIVAKRSDLQRDFFGVPTVRRDETTGKIVFEVDDPTKAVIEANKDSKDENTAIALRIKNGDGSSVSFHPTHEDAALALAEKAMTPVLDLDPKSLVGQFNNLRELTRKTKGKINALSLTGLASKAGLDYRLIDAAAPDFEGSKINQAVDKMVEKYLQWDADRGTQLVFCDLSVPLSAKAAAAKNEKRVYVLGDDSQLTHKKGTLHTAEGYEGFPFYLVRSGKGANASVSVYEPVSGRLLRSGLADKDAGKEWAATLLATESGRDKWFEVREQYEAITPERIVEYRDDNGLEVDEDGSNEISMDDLEAMSGAGAFSVYDDIKAKLIAKGIPENQIAFIHDYNTPKQKQELFKRVNAGDIRILMGSTPKLGAGTNVQERLVGLHHIDAPWRPSDLEQREGRIIRQGNKLYERDPDGFAVFIGRYATEQTYDTRRWQLLEHKAAGIEQLRKYSGENEIEDVAGEAANAADMKAAASGNPLILEETKLRTDVKRLTALRRAHEDGKYAMQNRIKHQRNRVETFIPSRIAEIDAALQASAKYPVPAEKGAIPETVIDGKKAKDKEDAEKKVGELFTRSRAGGMFGNGGTIRYRGVDFTVEGGAGKLLTLSWPLGNIGSWSPTEAVSSSGALTRMANAIDRLDALKQNELAELDAARKEIESLGSRINGAFEGADELAAATAQHAVIQRRLMKSTQMDAVPPNERAEFNKELADRKQQLIDLGYGKAVKEALRDSDVAFSRGGLTDAQAIQRVVRVQDLVNSLKAGWNNAPPIVVVSDMQDPRVPQRVRLVDAEMKANGATGEPRGFITGGTVYVVAGQHKSVSDVVTTVAHEVLGHAGLRGLYGEALSPILRQIVSVRRAEVDAKVREYGFDPKSERDLLRAAEEVLANMAQTQPELGFVKRAIAAIRKWLREQGLNLKLTDDDIIANYLLPARAFIENGGKPASVDRTLRPAYSRQATIPGTTTPQPAQITVQPPLGVPPGWSGSQASWDAPENTGFDNLVYKLQNKHIDTKRVVEAVQRTGAQLADKWNPYLQEELFHGRAAKRTLDFVERELNPLLNDANERGLTLDEIDQYLHARHAEEANKLIADRDPSMQDGGSGMKTAEARAYLAALPADKAADLAAVAARVDAIIATSRQLYADYGLESQGTVDEWGNMFQHYVPLMREDKDGAMGIGQGFSVKGREVKHRTGSTRAVVDILANIAMQREKVIVRGEKNRVAVSLAGLAKLNPNPDFWSFDKVPTERVLNEATGLVESRPDPLFKSRPNVIVAKIKGRGGKVEERAVVFNERNERAMRMAQALKNLDTPRLEGVMGVSAAITRYFASINTQYNPVFGFVNLTRDVQGALLNLHTTPLANRKAAIIGHTFTALRGIYKDARAERRGQAAPSRWAAEWEEFNLEGGQTGYRDLFATSADRAKAIQHALDPTAWMDSKLGRIFTAGGTLKVPMAVAQKGAGWIFDWLSDFNLTMENAVRLASYKVALEHGMSRQQAASLAKNLTVNFNRKGQAGQQAGALYAFFNASMQGTARIAETLTTMEPGRANTLRLSGAGKAIVGGGVLLGVMQAVMLEALGFDDDEPPEFVRERNLIIPLSPISGEKNYITIPMPLGYHVLPNIGRVLAEVAMDGGRDASKRVLGLFGVVAEAFNPLGGTLSLQTIAPTALDPFVALGTNEDWTGKPIAREDFNSMEPTPGFTRTKDTASSPSKALAEAINFATGGTDYTPGAMSPTPDQIDYLVAQILGGVGRELGKAEQTVTALATGEELPTYKIPLAGRFYGSSEGQAGQAGKFYENLKEAKRHDAELKGRRNDDLPTDDYLDANPDAQYLAREGNKADNRLKALRRRKLKAIQDGATRSEIKDIDAQITEVMQDFNATVAETEN